MPNRKQTIYKKANDGTITTKTYAEPNPKTTYATTVKIPVPPKKKG